jgi:hypothetical protein
MGRIHRPDFDIAVQETTDHVVQFFEQSGLTPAVLSPTFRLIRDAIAQASEPDDPDWTYAAYSLTTKLVELIGCDVPENQRFSDEYMDWIHDMLEDIIDGPIRPPSIGWRKRTEA